MSEKGNVFVKYLKTCLNLEEKMPLKKKGREVARGSGSICRFS
jgi:hypothetical protein